MSQPHTSHLFSWRRGRGMVRCLLVFFTLFLPGCAGKAGAARLLTDVVAVEAGWHHTCALKKSGQVMCWGNNDDGQLGDGTEVDRPAPQDVAGLMSKVTAVAVGERHSCALTAAGGVKCWGNNHNGQLGDGTRSDQITPVDVTGLTNGVQAVTAGWRHTCALTVAGGVKCWGNNHDGRLGDGTEDDKKTPVDVTGLTGLRAVAAGWRHTCALTAVGGVKCWGNNHNGQLGDGTRSDRTTPVDVVGLVSGITAVAAGWRHTCALTVAGGVRCWGKNHDGQLGDETAINSNTPVDVRGLEGKVTVIAAGGQHTCAVPDSYVKCWGDNEDGQLGDGTIIDTLAAREEPGI